MEVYGGTTYFSYDLSNNVFLALIRSEQRVVSRLRFRCSQVWLKRVCARWKRLCVTPLTASRDDSQQRSFSDEAERLKKEALGTLTVQPVIIVTSPHESPVCTKL